MFCERCFGNVLVTNCMIVLKRRKQKITSKYHPRVKSSGRQAPLLHEPRLNLFRSKKKNVFVVSYRYLIFPPACPQMCKISAPLKCSFSFCRAVQSGDRGFLKNKKIVSSLKMHCTQCRQANSRQRWKSCFSFKISKDWTKKVSVWSLRITEDNKTVVSITHLLFVFRSAKNCHLTASAFDFRAFAVKSL